jgi:hypothetical protein
MNVPDILIGLTAGLLVGGLLAWLAARTRAMQLSTRLEERDKEVGSVQEHPNSRTREQANSRTGH